MIFTDNESTKHSQFDYFNHVFYILSITDIESATANHALLGHKKCSAAQKTPFNWQIIMHGIFFVLWLISFWYYLTVREHVPQVKMLSIDPTAAKREIHNDHNATRKYVISFTLFFIMIRFRF